MDSNSIHSDIWGEDPIPIKDFIRKFRMPQVVRIWNGRNRRFQAPDDFSLRQPILLYKVYSCRKIHARALALDEKGHVNPTGPTLIIPDSYQGWLSMVTKDGKTAGFFTSIGEVSRADIPMFLVQDAVVALKATSTGLCRTVVSRGQVLKAIGPYEDMNRQSVLLANSGHMHQDVMMYLKCVTQQGDPIFLPYSARGRFYCISSPRAHSINHIFLISNLLRVTQLPILCRIVAGARPQIALPFTNVIQLEDVRQEVIILGCTLVDDEPVLLEINADSSFSFVRATDEQSLRRSSLYQKMCHFCTAEGDRWRQQIRIAHQIVTESTSRCPSKAGSVRSVRSVKSLKKVPALPTEERSHRENLIAELENWFRHSQSPGGNVVKYRKSFSCRGSIFPKKFWMFRKARKFDVLPGAMDKSLQNSRSDYVNMVSYAKSKNQNYTTVKIKTSNGAEVHIGGEKVRLEVQRFPYSDDGYVTSHAEDESIYHSIC